MRPATLLLTGVPQFVKLVDLSYNLDLLFDTNDIGTFELRDVSHYLGRRQIALDFSSCFDAFAAQSRLNGYVYVLPNGQEYMLNAKLAKKDMALRRVSCLWRSPSPVERAERRDRDANDEEGWDAIPVFPTMSEGVLARAHAKLDAQLHLLKKQKLIIKAQEKVLKAKKKLRKEYSKVDIASVEEPTSSGHYPLPRDPSRSKWKSQERRRSPVNPPGTPPIETTTTPTIETKEKNKPKNLQKKDQKMCKSSKRSRSSNRGHFCERSRSKNRRRSSSKNRRSSSKNRRSRCRSRRSYSGSQRSRSKDRWSSAKNRRPRCRRSRSHYCRSRSRSWEARKRWRSRTRDWSRSRECSPLRSRLRTLRSPEFNRNRDRVYTKRQFIVNGSVFRSPSSEPYPRHLAIMPGPFQDSQSIIVKRKITADPVIDYISNNTVSSFHESSARGLRYRCAADKDETVSKCTELYNTNNIVIIQKKLTDAEKNKDTNIKENVETSVNTHIIQAIPKSNEKKCDDVVDQDNSVLKKPLVEILLGICKESTLNTDPIGSYGQKDVAAELAGDVNNTVSSCYLDNKTHVSELAIEEETNNDSNLNRREIIIMDTNIDEDVKPILDLAKIPKVIEINAEYPSQHMLHKFLNDDFSNDVDVQLKEIKEELPSLLKPLEFVVNKDSNIEEVVKPVTQLEEISGVVEIKKEPLLPKRPKFVIIIQHLMKEMGASIRKVKHDFMKMSFQCKFKYVLRLMLREIVFGKGRMTKSEIRRSFRDRYPREQDDEFARRVVEDIQAGKYGNLGPSDDELSDDHVGDDLVLVENEHETIIISDSDDKENMHDVTEVKIEKNDIVPEFTDTEVENLLKCMEKVEPGTADPRDGTETPHVTGITIMTSLSELFSLKYGKQVPTKEEKEIKIEHNPLTEEYVNDDAQYYNPYT